MIDLNMIKERKAKYGNNFPLLCKLWNTFLAMRGHKCKLAPEEVAALMALMKVSRMATAPENEDSMIDYINYMWIGLNYEEYVNQ